MIPPRAVRKRYGWRLAWKDLTEAVELSWFWLALGWNDILQRYRGSMLGPFWLTLTTAAFIIGLGPLYAQLFGLDMKTYLPYLAIGFTTWGYINNSINDSCNTFISAADTMKQIRLPKLALLFQVIWRNSIVFAHNIPIFVAVIYFFSPTLTPVVLLAIPGFILVTLNLIWIGLTLAVLCARFRDITPIVGAIMQIAFFLTPVIWNLKNHRVDPLYVALNPFAAYIELIRAPLLNEVPDPVFVLSAMGTLAVGSAFAAIIFTRARPRIIYWV